ncbi:MAG: CapA family protein [Candidatus Cloacimonadaceae bacterium]|jgi:hypothetical protein|nr:CapA family protein [Candidatus Cloacimonadota bacterium]MDX9949459.1 CapA family protein [Candidatus Syntrophosphaera sp.]
MTKTMTRARKVACYMRKIISGSLFLLLFSLVLDTWPGKTEAAYNPRTYAEATKSMVETSRQYLGRPYKFRNPQGNIMDCSGFVQYIYSLHGVSIPRTASTQYASCRSISLSEAQPGDLMFFRGTNLSSNKIGHVAMVVENNGNGLKMIHSSSRGVVIDDYYNSSHYLRRFLYAGRMPQLEAKYPSFVAPTRNVTVIGVGDIMLGTNYPSANYLPPNDGRDLLNPVKHILSSADLTFANLEGVILSGTGVPKKCSNPSTCFAFKSPDHYGGYLRDAGIDLVSLANNHVGDFGASGKSNTVKMLDELGIKFAGLKEYPSVTFTKDDIRYGFCAFAPNNGTMQINDYKEVARIVKELKQKSDIVIVSFHGGAEGSDKTRVNGKTEFFLGENRGNPHEFARVAIDAGADIVFGHGPHVTRAIDIYKGRFIAYSLGNFCTYGRFNLSGNLGLAPIIKVTVTGTGEFVDAQITSIRQPGKGGPILDDGHSALKEIIKLTNLDFPESELVISQDGRVTRKSDEPAVSQR